MLNQAVLKACEELKDRMQPTKDKMPDADWPTLVEACFNANVDLIARHWYFKHTSSFIFKHLIHLYEYSYTSKDSLKGYVIHGATVSEVEVDVLTGEKLVIKVLDRLSLLLIMLFIRSVEWIF